MAKPLLLDLFCGAGGAAVGYHRAGFRVIGVDINPQPNYPFEFQQYDAVLFVKRLIRGAIGLGGLVAVHASPPCQRYTMLAKGNNGNPDDYPDLVPPIRELLDDLGLPYVIENVPGAPIRDDLTLCGLSFGLNVFRHRKFEMGQWKVETVPHPSHKGHRVAGWRHGQKYDGDMVAVYGDGGGKGSVEQWQQAMGINWTGVRKEIAEAIPPAYTEYIGRQLLDNVTMNRN